MDIWDLYGLPYAAIRLTVPGFNFCDLTDGSAVIERNVIQTACCDMVTEPWVRRNSNWFYDEISKLDSETEGS